MSPTDSADAVLSASALRDAYTRIDGSSLFRVAECTLLHAEGLERETQRKRAIRGLQHRLDLRDIATAWIQLYVSARAGRTLRFVQQADEGMGRYDEGTARSEGRSSDCRSYHHLRPGTGCRLHDAVHALR